MANQNTIIHMIETLTQINRSNPGHSEAQNRTTQVAAQQAVRDAGLDEDTTKTVCNAIAKAANPTGWYYETNGIKAGIAALEALLEEIEASQAETSKPAQPVMALNYRNLQNLIADGHVFHVEFIKRTTGEMRLMQCRTGVKKHLKGGKKAYNAKSKDLLTVFDMKVKGYRSISVDGIQELRVNGQSFTFAGV